MHAHRIVESECDWAVGLQRGEFQVTTRQGLLQRDLHLHRHVYVHGCVCMCLVCVWKERAHASPRKRASERERLGWGVGKGRSPVCPCFPRPSPTWWQCPQPVCPLLQVGKGRSPPNTKYRFIVIVSYTPPPRSSVSTKYRHLHVSRHMHTSTPRAASHRHSGETGRVALD